MRHGCPSFGSWVSTLHVHLDPGCVPCPTVALSWVSTVSNCCSILGEYRVQLLLYLPPSCAFCASLSVCVCTRACVPLCVCACVPLYVSVCVRVCAALCLCHVSHSRAHLVFCMLYSLLPVTCTPQGMCVCVCVYVVQAARPTPNRCVAARPTPNRCVAARPTPNRCVAARPTPNRCVAHHAFVSVSARIYYYYLKCFFNATHTGVPPPHTHARTRTYRTSTCAHGTGSVYHRVHCRVGLG